MTPAAVQPVIFFVIVKKAMFFLLIFDKIGTGVSGADRNRAPEKRYSYGTM